MRSLQCRQCSASIVFVRTATVVACIIRCVVMTDCRLRMQVDHGSPLLSLAPIASLIGAAAALGLSAALYQRLERRFVFTDYIHAEK